MNHNLFDTFAARMRERGNANALNAQTAGLLGTNSGTMGLLLAVGLAFVLFKAMDGNN